MSQTHVKPDRRSTASTPRWVKVFGIITIVLTLLFVILIITGGLDGHGPRHHGDSRYISVSTVVEDGRRLA